MQKACQALGDARLLLEHDRAEAAVNRADYDAFAVFETAADLLVDVERSVDVIDHLLRI